MITYGGFCEFYDQNYRNIDKSEIFGKLNNTYLLPTMIASYIMIFFEILFIILLIIVWKNK